MDCNGHKTRIDRRSLLAVGASSVAAAMIGGRARAEAPAPGEAARSPAHALEGLLEGNNRFVSQPQVCEIDLAKQRASVAGAVGDDPQLRRQPRSPRARIRRPGPR